MASSKVNPYRSPQVVDDGLPRCNVAGDSFAPLQAELTRAGRLYRSVHLTGRIDASIQWDASGVREFVAVNGNRVVSQASLIRNVPRFCFAMQAGDCTYLVTVEISVRRVFLVEAFRILIDDEVAYEEVIRAAGRPK